MLPNKKFWKQEGKSTDFYRKNTKSVKLTGKKKAFKDHKSLLKAFPDKAETIESYLKENKVKRNVKEKKKKNIEKIS